MGEPLREKKVRKKIDESLITRIGRDDRDALEELYRLTERPLYSYVLAIVKNPCDTQDIVQETYLKIRACAHLYRPQGKPMAWIFTIARNLSLNYIRLNSRQIQPEEGEMENSIELSYVQDPVDRLVLESALRLLREQEREIIFLHLVAGLKHREIAGLLHLPLSTVLSGYRRALTKMKSYLEEEMCIRDRRHAVPVSAALPGGLRPL